MPTFQTNSTLNPGQTFQSPTVTPPIGMSRAEVIIVNGVLAAGTEYDLHFFVSYDSGATFNLFAAGHVAGPSPVNDHTGQQVNYASISVELFGANGNPVLTTASTRVFCLVDGVTAQITITSVTINAT